MVLGCSVTGLLPDTLPSKCLVGYLTYVDQSESPDGQMTDDEFAATVAQWLAENLTGKFAQLKGKGGPGSEHEFFEQRLEWDKHLAASGWTCLGWPKEFGGRGASISQQVIFHQEYAKAGAPARVSHIGEELLGPTLIAYGTDEQKRRFLPGINTVSELWSQGYSEPGAGSDLANVSTQVMNGLSSSRIRRIFDALKSHAKGLTAI